MSAVIETLISDENRGDYWIGKKVVRVGSGSDCEVRVDQSEIAPHVATVRFRNGQYVIYNRSGGDLAIAGRMIARDQSDVWHANESLLIAPEVMLQLIVDGNPAPCPQPDNEMRDSYQQKRSEELRLKSIQEAEAKENEESTQIKRQPSGSQNALGLFFFGLAGLIGLSLATFVFLNLMQSATKKPFNPQSVAKSLLARSSELPPSLVQLLQEAQQSVEVKDRESAKSRLKRLQTELVRLKSDGHDLTISQGDGRVGFEDALRAYINDYLSQLEKN